MATYRIKDNLGEIRLIDADTLLYDGECLSLYRGKQEWHFARPCWWESVDDSWLGSREPRMGC